MRGLASQTRIVSCLLNRIITEHRAVDMLPSHILEAEPGNQFMHTGIMIEQGESFEQAPWITRCRKGFWFTNQPMVCPNADRCCTITPNQHIPIAEQLSTVREADSHPPVRIRFDWIGEFEPEPGPSVTTESGLS